MYSALCPEVSPFVVAFTYLVRFGDLNILLSFSAIVPWIKHLHRAGTLPQNSPRGPGCGFVLD